MPAWTGIIIRVHQSLIIPTTATTSDSTGTPHPTQAGSSYPYSTTGTSNLPPSIPGYLYLIKGSLDEIRRYSGTTADWIIKIASSICDPFGEGQIYTHTTGALSDWYDRDRDSSWRQVGLGDPLLPGIYEFVTTAGNLITLSRISERKARSKTSRGSGSSATSFRRHLELRDDKRCVVTRNKCHSLHLISSQNAWAQMVQKKW